MAARENSLQGRVAIVTGAGKGWARPGRRTWHRGARLVINNRGRRDQPGGSSVDQVGAQIRAEGGDAVANHDSVELADAAPRLIELAFALWPAGYRDRQCRIDRAGSFHKQGLAELRMSLMSIFRGWRACTRPGRCCVTRVTARFVLVHRRFVRQSRPGSLCIVAVQASSKPWPSKGQRAMCW